MKDFMKKVESADFAKCFKKLLLISLIVVATACALNGFMFRTQITEMMNMDKLEKRHSQQIENKTSDMEWKLSERENGGHDDDMDIWEGKLSTPTIGALVVAGISILLFGLCALAYWLMVAAWLYKVALKANMNFAMWSVLGLLFNILAVLAFLIVRGRHVRCPQCDTWQEKNNYCRSCGAILRTVCNECGSVCRSSDSFCPECGSAVERHHKTNSRSDEDQ